MKKILNLSIMLVTMGCSGGQKHNHAQEHMHSHNFDDLVKSFDSPERDSWQKPDTVVKFVQDTYLKKNKKAQFTKATLADLGAGSGYFSFRFLSTGARVIALDIDERFLNLLRQRAESHPQRRNFEARGTDANTANINMNEADIILNVNVYHHIEDRTAYFRKMRWFIKKNGFLVVIDFKEGDVPKGPPAHMKIPASQMISELKAAGYKVSIHSDILPYQHILVAEP